MSEIANMPGQVPPGEYEDIVMPEHHRHLANKCEDIVNLEGAEAYCVATRTVWYTQVTPPHIVVAARLQIVS